VSAAKPPRILIIAGSDSSGGAGIQADIKTVTALGAYAMTAITAVTAQDTMGVHAVHLLPPELVRAQIIACLNDIGADVIKIGMLGSADICEAVAGELEAHARAIPLVIDPVMASTSGTKLLDDDTLTMTKSRLFPLATLVTLNIPEAEILSGVSICSEDELIEAVRRLGLIRAKAILIKGGHATWKAAEVVDSLFEVDSDESFYFESPRVDTKNTHGTGCTLATAIAVGLAQGLSLSDAVERAHHFVHEAIRTAPGFGSGQGPLNHMHAVRSI